MKLPSGCTVTVPCVGSLSGSSVKVGTSPSTSVAVTLPATGVSSGVVTPTGGPAGASFTGVTMTSTVIVVVPVASHAASGGCTLPPAAYEYHAWQRRPRPCSATLFVSIDTVRAFAESRLSATM